MSSLNEGMSGAQQERERERDEEVDAQMIREACRRATKRGFLPSEWMHEMNR